MHSKSEFGLSPLGARATAPSNAIDDKAIKGGNLFIKSLQFPEEVGPNEAVEVSVTVSNGGTFISGDDPDICEHRGYGSILTVNPGFDAPQDREYCHGMATFGTRDLNFSFSFTSPSLNSTTAFNLLVRLRTPASGQSLTIRRTITVLPGTVAECTSDADCPTGEVCQNNECVPKDSNGGNGGGGCTSDADCGGNLVCQNGQCAQPTDDDTGVIFGLSQAELLAASGALVGAVALASRRSGSNGSSGRQSNTNTRSR